MTTRKKGNEILSHRLILVLETSVSDSESNSHTTLVITKKK